eukprot:g6234.t1
MKLLFAVVLLLAAPLRATSTDPSWSDEFASFNSTKWQAASWLGGWNGEFSWYTGTRNLDVENGTLFIQPDLTANFRPEGSAQPIGWPAVLGCGRNDPLTARADACPNKTETPTTELGKHGLPACTVGFDPSKCANTAGACINTTVGLLRKKKECTTYSVLPPATSGSIRTARSFRFGRLEVRARLPRGDWLWPAIWLLPENSKFGGWPTSGEIDIMESRGNAPNACGPGQGRRSFGSTLHFGPGFGHNAFLHTHTEYTLQEQKQQKEQKEQPDLSDDFHTYGLEWGEKGLYTYIDDREKGLVLAVDFTEESFWERGQKWEMVCFRREGGKCTSWQPRWPAWHNGTGGVDHNPWAGENGTNATPFDQTFFLQMNVAVGGTGKFFPNLLCKGKPWSNEDANPRAQFLEAFDKWWPSWGGDLAHVERGASRHAALAVESVRYWEA